MRSRAWRLSCGVLAWIAIGAAAVFIVRSEQRLAAWRADGRAFDLHAREVTDALSDLRAAQQAYVAAGQGVAFWMPKVAQTADAISASIATLRTAGTSAGARRAIDESLTALAEFTEVDKRARDYLRAGQLLMAGDVIFTEGSDAAATAVRQIETARQAQHQAVDLDVAALRGQETLTAGVAAGVAGIVVLLLIPVPRRQTIDMPADTSLAVNSISLGIAPAVEAAASIPSGAVTARGTGSVFKAATDVSTEFGRVRDLDDLARVLGRAADVMDASGLMVWVGSAMGGDLRPVLAHGYSAEMLARLPPVARSSDNAAAAAYRSGELQIVLSRPGGSSGAVVAPILSADGCIGALSAEIRSGGETSESVQALAAIFAAHLAGVLATAPAAEIKGPRAAGHSSSR